MKNPVRDVFINTRIKRAQDDGVEVTDADEAARLGHDVDQSRARRMITIESKTSADFSWKNSFQSQVSDGRRRSCLRIERTGFVSLLDSCFEIGMPIFNCDAITVSVRESAADEGGLNPEPEGCVVQSSNLDHHDAIEEEGFW